MIPMKLSQVRFKFFDSRLLSKAERARLGFLTRAGGWIRKTARRSIRPAPKKRTPKTYSERPPYFHRNSPIRYRDTIFYYVEKSEGRMYAGAILLNGRGGHKIPKILEHGGMGTYIDPQTRQRKTARYRAFPHMRPAMEKFIKEQQNQLLKNSIVAR